MRATTFPVALLSLTVACARPAPTPPPRAPVAAAAERFPPWPARPRAAAGDAFTRAWSDGRAELSGYRARVDRYGEMRDAELVLVYVTEPLDRRTWVKDDDAPAEHRVGVLKLNASLKFQTGVYPYSVLTSVFAPVDRYQPEAFSPVKITLSVQEWCGHVFHGVWPGDDRATEQLMSYFPQEGERRRDVPTPPGTLYEDALLIQLRELDGPFAGGGDWRGRVVPSLWSIRRAHRPMAAVEATITRSRAAREGAAVHRFVLRYGDVTRTLDVEAEGAHRVLGWETSDGEVAGLVRPARLPYWQLNHNGDEAQRALFGVAPTPGGADAGGAPRP
jgi:hypothetical protein